MCRAGRGAEGGEQPPPSFVLKVRYDIHTTILFCEAGTNRLADKTSIYVQIMYSVNTAIQKTYRTGAVEPLEELTVVMDIEAISTNERNNRYHFDIRHAESFS